MDINNSIAAIQFVGSSVKSIVLHNDFIILNETQELNRSVNVDYEIDEISENIDEDDSVYGTITLFVNIEISDGKSRLTIEMDLQGCFVASKDLNREEFKNMLSVNGCATLYSIARSIIISMTSQSLAQGSVILPMINAFKLKEEKVDNK